MNKKLDKDTVILIKEQITKNVSEIIFKDVIEAIQKGDISLDNELYIDIANCINVHNIPITKEHHKYARYVVWIRKK